MKAVIFASLASLALTGCSVSADGPPLSQFAIPGKPSAQDPTSTVAATFVTSCSSAGGTSFRLQMNMKGKTPAITQTSYLDNASCIGRPGDAAVVSSVVTSSPTVQVSADGSKAIITSADGAVYTATKIDAVPFTAETGLYVAYEGMAVSGSSAKSASMFAQIVGQSPYADHFPYIWTFVNGRETNPRSNPWVWSGALTSGSYARMMSRCATPVAVTVSAGRFQTCLVATGAEKVWYGNVPLYGIVKYEKPEGTETTAPYIAEMLSGLGLPNTAALSVELKSVGY